MATSGGAAAMKLGRRPLWASPYSVNWETTSTPAPPSSSSPRFILPASSAKSRSDRIFSAIQASVSSVSVGANPASTTNPVPIPPIVRPSTRTSARLTRCSTTLMTRRIGGWTDRRMVGVRSDYPSIRLSAYPPSFHGHRLREVARLVHIAAAAHGDVVGEQLQRQDREHRREQIEGFGDREHVLGQTRQARIAVGDDRDHAAPARLHLFHVREHLLVHG